VEFENKGKVMRIKERLLTGLGVTKAKADNFLPDLNNALSNHQINTPLRIAHFLAQVLHESARMKYVKENMNYSEQALLRYMLASQK
jgi:predicted chitinase